MKLAQVLKESAVLTFRDLTSIQIYYLKALLNGTLTYDNANPKQMAGLDDLLGLGLLDDQYELNEKGKVAANLGMKYGSSDRRAAAATGAAPVAAGSTTGEDLSGGEDDELDAGGRPLNSRLGDLRTSGF